MSLNLMLLKQTSAARHGRCPPGLPQFLNHTCQIVKTSGSAGDGSPVGEREFCYLCTPGAGLALRGERGISGAEFERWLERARRPLINDKTHTHEIANNEGVCARLLTRQWEKSGGILYVLYNMLKQLDSFVRYSTKTASHNVNSCTEDAQIYYCLDPTATYCT